MNATPTAFLEIEHKFVVDADFDRDALFERCRALGPEREKALTVTDTYYVPRGQADRIYRHRIDKEIQQLTLKSRGGDNEVRTEINLELGAARSQADAVKAWMGVIGALPGYGIVKQIRVFDFPDCEVVYYEANHKALRVCCVEFEAKYAASEEDGLATLHRYEQQFGFVAERREKVNLFDLLVTAQA